MSKKIAILLSFVFFALWSDAQSLGASPEYIKTLTAAWKGERFTDGRPRVPDVILSHLKEATLEQIWGFLGRKGFRNQVEKDWIILKPGETMVGRVVTAQFMPSRPDLDSMVRTLGKAEGRSQKGGVDSAREDRRVRQTSHAGDG